MRMPLAKQSVNIVKLHKAKAFDETGAIILGTLWESKPVILIFLRHFACMACRAHASQVWAQKDVYTKAGVQLIFIGNGAPFLINTFKEDLHLKDARILTDPSLESFYAAGFKRGFIAALGPTALKNSYGIYSKSKISNTSYSKASGDLWQLGGIVAVKPGDVVSYHYISQATGLFLLRRKSNALPGSHDF